MQPVEVLKKFWGYDTFRPLQLEIIEGILKGEDTVALLPTGGGKSVCFQVPALMREGICLVISPLIALMKDQVENLKMRGIEAEALFSGMRKDEIQMILQQALDGRLKFLYVSPERAIGEDFQEYIRQMPVTLIAIDEAHCISQWGYDFRPPYLELRFLRELHPDVPMLALTATATNAVVQDIQLRLGFHKRNVCRKSFYRDNLTYWVLKDENKFGRMLQIIRKNGGSGIVYVRNRRKTQEIAKYLFAQGISADYYHAGLDADDRSKKQDRWKQNDTKVIVATNAFGMGIDKPDVRFVIHLEPPDSLEAYYQEAGRAGRDEKRAYAFLIYEEQDGVLLRKNFEEGFPELEFVRNVYQRLGSYFQLAYGAGFDMMFDLDLISFCKKFDLDTKQVLNSLKILEQDGWLRLSESVFIPSRFKFELRHGDLYRFQVENKQFDSFIKLLLRNYGGGFEAYVPFRERELVQRTGWSYELVHEKFMKLQQLGVLRYIQAKDGPQLHFLRPRVDNQHLHLDIERIRALKMTREKQVDSVLKYVQEDRCRSQQLLEYFDELRTEPCEVCDVCVRKKQKEKGFSNLNRAIIQLLSQQPMNLRDIVERLQEGDDSQKINSLRMLLDQGFLREEDGIYYCDNGITS